jgi:hypothetical protein
VPGVSPGEIVGREEAVFQGVLKYLEERGVHPRQETIVLESA